MHLLFGEVVKNSSVYGYSNFYQGVKNLYRSETKRFRRRYIIVWQMGEGKLVGSATDGDSFLLLLGAIHLPLPDWKDSSSPLDDLNHTAAWLLQRYIKIGDRFLENILGGFAIVLWDALQHRFFLCNDAMGHRQFFYTMTPRGFAFSTTLFALNFAVKTGLEIDRSHEDFLLGYEFLPPRRTVYKNVFCLPAGKILEWHAGKFRELKLQKPNFSRYRIENLTGKHSSEKAIGNFTYDLFMNCLEQMLPCQKRIAVLLGGFDSALIAVGLKKLGKDVDTYTFRFPDKSFNQAFVDMIAKTHTLRHTWVDINPEVLRKGLNEYYMYYNLPSSVPHYLIQSLFLFKKIRKEGHHFCFTGDGCDELFLGYPSVYNRARFFLKLGNIPVPMLNIGLALLRLRFVECLFGQPVRFIRNILSIAKRPWPRRGHVSNRIFDSVSLSHLRTEQPKQSVNPEVLLASFSNELDHLTVLRLAYNGKSLPGLNRSKIVSGSSSAGIFVLSPFQHPAMIEFAFSLPEKLLRPKSKKSAINGKYILMNAVKKRNLLDNRVIYQRKASPVAGMADLWYMGPLRDFLIETYSKLPFSCNKYYLYRLLTQKFTEEFIRKRISLGKYVLTAPALLATYASFNQFKQTEK